MDFTWWNSSNHWNTKYRAHIKNWIQILTVQTVPNGIKTDAQRTSLVIVTAAAQTNGEGFRNWNESWGDFSTQHFFVRYLFSRCNMQEQEKLLGRYETEKVFGEKKCWIEFNLVSEQCRKKGLSEIWRPVPGLSLKPFSRCTCTAYCLENSAVLRGYFCSFSYFDDA